MRVRWTDGLLGDMERYLLNVDDVHDNTTLTDSFVSRHVEVK